MVKSQLTIRFAHLLTILILVSSIVLVVMISLEILNTFPPVVDSIFLRIQFWICMIFLTDFFFHLFTSQRRWHYLSRNWLFLIVSIPYASIVSHINIDVGEYMKLFFKIIPLVRGAYGFIMVIGWMTKNNVTNLLVSYLTILASLIWFSALIFYKFEGHVNSGVTDFWDALWWAMMLATTVGSDINAQSFVGQILSFFIAFVGLLIFPIITIYIGDKLKLKISTPKSSPQK